jgi:hypothetical protein
VHPLDETRNKELVALGPSFVTGTGLGPFGDIADTFLLGRQ